MSQTLLIRSATVIRNTEPPGAADVLIRDGKVTDVAAKISPPKGARVIEAAGKILLPGLFDTHAHLREPGREDTETMQTGVAAAIHGGITGLVCMPDTTPAIDNGGMVQSALDVASKTPLGGDIFIAGCITKGRRGEELAEIGDMHDRGAVLITDDPDAVSNPLLMRRALQYARDLNLPVAAHCDLRELTGIGAMNDGRISYRLGLPGIPSCSEEICLARDIRLAQSVLSGIHINHVTTAQGVETIARYKKDGMKVTAGAALHHLIFCDEDVGDYDTNYKVKPPLRTREDREAMREGIRNGKLDLIVTDHDPHTEFEKEREFSAAPFGMIALDTALPALHHYLIAEGHVDWPTVVERFSKAPRRLIGQPIAAIEPGQRVNCVLFDPGAETLVERSTLGSKSLNTPFLGQRLRGKVQLVCLDGRVLLDRLPA